MIITVKNLGVIKKAEFDTSKKLTVFCGPNSTGKTYLAFNFYKNHMDTTGGSYSLSLIPDSTNFVNEYPEIDENILRLVSKGDYVYTVLSNLNSYWYQCRYFFHLYYYYYYLEMG